MFKVGTPKESSQGIKRNTAYRKQSAFTPTSNFSLGDSAFEKEALKIYDEVQANRRMIFTRNSDPIFYTKKIVRTTKKDPSGTEVIEKFEATAYGGFSKNGEKVGEVVQQYLNEKTGLEKSSLQRILGNKSRKVEIKKTIDFENTDDLQLNIDNNFEKDWKEQAKKIGVKKVINFETTVKNLSLKKHL
ncbi:hypothetical protein SteCoe_25195 [Stentor coeruleus]|uniref:Uncharacterized protein n=1 Tax=Stentor coeruleus TaxID=5963 RepID=A0A1R2BFT7_9CILI|nr:hypothetical protein SteCoe_25195 [Stentor coeruleus]